MNFDCDNLEKFLLGLSGDGSAGAFKGKREGGKEHPYSCVVLAGQRTMDERRRALQVGLKRHCDLGRITAAQAARWSVKALVSAVCQSGSISIASCPGCNCTACV